MRHRLLNWLGWSGLDAIGRLALLTGGTAIFSRYLTPRDFGGAALILTVVTLASVFVGAPFEKALVQRKVLRPVHLRASLAACWLGWLVFFIPLGLLLVKACHEPRFAIRLAIGGAIAILARLICTALSAKGRPEDSLTPFLETLG